MECSREKEIIDVATIMRHGLTLNKQMKDRSDNANAIGLLKYFTTHTKSEEKLKSIKTHEISDIFQPFQSKNGSTIVPKYILIEGAPGMGKTTLCKEIAYQWAEQCLLKDTELLFLIYLRDPAVANIKHLKDFVHYFYNFDEDATEQSKQCAKILNSRDSNDVTMIFDGFDEFDSSSDSLITDILHRKVLPLCRIVVTSRLTASDRLHRIANVRVEVLGFSDESKIQYIKQVLKEHPDKVNKLQSYLNTHPSIQSICYMPIMMTILVYVFKEKGYLPTNSTELYDKFVALTISRQNKSADLCVSMQTLPTECKSFLLNLSKFAFLTLQSNQKVFSKEDINNICPNLTLTSSDLDSLGLINAIQYFSTDKGNTRVFNFLHLSIHEYLAAYYISSIDQCRQFIELENTFLNEMYQETWNMFIAMNKNKKTWLNFQNYSVYSKDIHYESLSKWIADHKSLSFSECFFQLYNIINANSMSSDVVQIIFSKIDISAANANQEQIYLSLWDVKNACHIELKLFIIDEAITLLNSNWFMLFHHLLIINKFSVVFYKDHYLSLIKATQKQIIDFFKCNNSIKIMSLEDCHITKSSIDAIRLSCLQCLLFFRAFSCSFEHSALIKLTNYLNSISTLLSITLKFLNIDNTQTMHVIGEALASVVTHNTGLKELHIADNNLGEGMLVVTKALQQITSLRSIDLGNNNLSKETSGVLALAIQSNRHLEKLWLYNNNLKCSATAILQSLSTISTLKLLNVSNTQTTDEAGEALASVILHNKGLEELYLAGNNFGKGVLIVTKALQQITSLRSIDLGNNNVSKEASGELALAIQSNKHLEKLWLHDNNLKSSVIAILQSLSTISTLKLLNINNTQTMDEAGEALASVVKHNTGLEELHLAGNNLAEGMLVVTKALQQITSLRSIDFGNNNLSKEASGELALAIQSNKHLKKLWLHNNNLKCSATAILQSLSTISTLKLLNVSNTQTTDEAGEALASVILHNKGLEELYLAGNNFGKGVLIVTKALQQITSLRSIDLGNNNVSKEASGELALAIQSNKHLEKLWLHDNNLKSSVIAILQSLSTISTLKLLNINNTQTMDEAGEALASVVKHNTGLEELHLAGNNLAEGMLVVTKALQQITSLRSIDFGNNNLSKEASGELALAIQSNKHLEKLWLHNNNNLKSSVITILQSLSTISTLKLLNINNTQTMDEAGEALASVVKHNTGLEELYLNDNILGEGMLIIIKALQQITSLRSINLGNNNMSKEASGELALAIQSNKHLEELWLYNNNLKFSAIAILQSLSTISNLKYLNINNTQITNEACEALASVVLLNKGLEELHLTNNNLGEGLLILTKALQHITSLRSIDLGNNNLSKEASGELALAIQSNKQLENLGLRNNNLKCSAITILQSLSTISTLKLLIINNTQITEEAGEALASVVVHNTGLEELYLSNNNLGEGMLVVIKTLQQLTSLKSIGLTNTNISKEASGELALAIQSNKDLQKLWLYNNNLKCLAIAIFQSLSTISTLKLLNINNNQITEEAGEALASVVSCNTGLEELYLSDNKLGERMLIVTKSLQQLTSLKSIDLGNTNISKEASDELALAIESNKHLEKLWLHNNNLKSSVIAILQSLSTISTLKLLKINNTQTMDEAGEALASVVKHNTGLEELHLAGNNLAEGMLVVTKALQQITSLRSIDFGNTNISKEASGELALAIQSNKHLETLSLHDNNLKPSAISILQSLSTISTLKFLNINNTQITDEAGEALASVVLHNTRLQELGLRDNKLGEGMLIVTKALQQITSLRSIDLSNSNLSKEASGELALVIQSNKHLEKLWLYNNNNLKPSVITILQSLSTISTLKLLNINNTQTMDEAGEALASVVKHNTGLEELYLSNSNLGEGMLIVTKALQQITSLRSIDLCNNNISSMVSILRSLHHNSLLKSLDLCGNTITEDAGNALAAVISRNIKLQELSLNLLTEPLLVTKSLQNLSALQTLVFDTCNISGEAEANLASAITCNRSLTFLSLENVKLSQIIILQSIATVSNLRTLWLGDSSLSDKMSDELLLAISSNKSLERLILLDNMLQTGLIKIAKACNKLSNIKVLQLAHNCIVPSKVVELTSVITQNTSLERLLLGGITLNAAECFHLNINEVLCKTDMTSDTSGVASCNHCASLEVIYLEMLRKQIDNNKKCFNDLPIYVNAKNFVFIQKFQCYFNQSDITQLKTHDVKQKLLQVDAKKMISSLFILEKVKVIDLENNNIDEDASLELATALHSNNVLEQLWLRGNKLNTAGALYILNSLEYLTTLQVLDLSYNNISSQSADGIAAVIDSNPLLNQLWLDGNDLHSTGTIKICKALKKIGTLSILSLCNNGITDDAGDELSAVITQNVLLEDLLLSNNQLHSTGIELIAESLNKLIKLRKLDLLNNNIGKEGASSLAVVVQNSTSLQDLFLSSNNLETSGALEICNALSHICSLHVLTLSNNNINDEVTSQLIEVLSNNHLYALLIGGNSLECGGLKIAEVIENGNIAMQLLDLSDNNISEQDKEKIKFVFSKRANFQLYV